MRRTGPHRAGTPAGLLAVMQTDLRRTEIARRPDRRAPSFGLKAAFGERMYCP